MSFGSLLLAVSPPAVTRWSAAVIACLESIGGFRAVDCSVAVIGSGESHGTDVAYQALIHLRGTLSVSIRRLVVDKRRQDRTKKQRLRRGGPPSVEE